MVKILKKDAFVCTKSNKSGTRYEEFDGVSINEELKKGEIFDKSAFMGTDIPIVVNKNGEIICGVGSPMYNMFFTVN